MENKSLAVLLLSKPSQFLFIGKTTEFAFRDFSLGKPTSLQEKILHVKFFTSIFCIIFIVKNRFDRSQTRSLVFVPIP